MYHKDDREYQDRDHDADEISIDPEADGFKVIETHQWLEAVPKNVLESLDWRLGTMIDITSAMDTQLHAMQRELHELRCEVEKEIVRKSSKDWYNNAPKDT
tara:strand:+ start:10547 stop:10849 length:303 start_codon:yes stop_codon:yes gene_type:complete